MAQRLYLPIEQVFSDLGAIGAGYKLNTYETGTTTPKATYSNVALSSANTNPIVADSAGRLGNIFVDDLSTYKLVLTDVDDVEIWSADPVDPKTFSLADFDPRPTSFWGTTAGTSTAYTLDADPDVSAYSSTQTFYFACHTDSGASPTMAVDGLTALNLKKYNNQGSKVSLESLDMESGQTYEARNDGTDIVILNPNITEYSKNNKLNLNPNTATISSGAITYSGAHMVIDTESAAASDDLDTISGANDGDIAIIRISDSSRNVVLKHGTGNLNLINGQDITLDTITDKIILIFRGSSWDQLSRTLGSDIFADIAIRFNASAPPTILDSKGVSSLTRLGTGSYRINFSETLPNANYYVSATCGFTSFTPMIAVVSALTTSLEIKCQKWDSASFTSEPDLSNISILIFR